MLIKVSHPSHFPQTVKDHISGRLLPLISHGNLCRNWIFLSHLEWGSGQAARQWGRGSVSRRAWCCFGYVIWQAERRKKNTLVFWTRVCFLDATACALNSWAYYHPPAGVKVRVAHSYGTAGRGLWWELADRRWVTGADGRERTAVISAFRYKQRSRLTPPSGIYWHFRASATSSKNKSSESRQPHYFDK